MAEGACLSPQSSMCLTIYVFVCVFVLNSFTSVMHSIFFAVTSNSKLFFLISPLPCQYTQPTVSPNSFDFYRGNILFKHTVITQVCDALTTCSVALGSFGLGLWLRLRLLLEPGMDIWLCVWSHSGISCAAQLCGFICFGVNNSQDRSSQL